MFGRIIDRTVGGDSEAAGRIIDHPAGGDAEAAEVLPAVRDDHEHHFFCLCAAMQINREVAFREKDISGVSSAPDEFAKLS
ncbi:MAG: hypothetical protein GX099_03160 [Clostridiaceae bacterium]|jgi:hypothetical protein|nr:hypothetical protein [Clostridiaceae bacterium]